MRRSELRLYSEEVEGAAPAVSWGMEAGNFFVLPCVVGNPTLLVGLQVMS